MSFKDLDGEFLTIARSAADRRGVVFVDGAHTGERGEVQHRNDAGSEPGLTMIITFRADVTGAFEHMSEVQRLFAHLGLALFKV